MAESSCRRASCSTPGFIEEISSLDVTPDKQGGGQGAEVIVYPSQTRNVDEQSRQQGGAKQGIGQMVSLC